MRLPREALITPASVPKQAYPPVLDALSHGLESARRRRVKGASALAHDGVLA
jgi:hypothetical protein